MPDQDLVQQILHALSEILGAADRLHPLSANRTRRLVLGFSGGLDSSVLLHVLKHHLPQGTTLAALHVDHRLQPDSDKWALHCVTEAHALDVPLEILTVDSAPPAGQSIEAWAREQRYALLRQRLVEGDVLLTAHHQGDQSETFLLQLLRGAGPHGLSAIRPVQAFPPGILARPLLQTNRAQLQRYQTQANVSFIDDPSNSASEFDRNYLRNVVLPALIERWPHVGERISQAAKLQQGAAVIIDRQADHLISTANDGEKPGIDRGMFVELSPEERFWVLRRWLSRMSLPLPEQAHFNEIERVFFCESPRTTAQVVWKGIEMRYYDQRLYVHPLPEAFDHNVRIPWDLADDLQLPTGRLRLAVGGGPGLLETLRDSEQVYVTYYQKDGTRCHPTNRQHSQRLKKLFQEFAVPPWRRGRIPILMVDETVAAVIPYFICRGFEAAAGEPAIQIDFHDALFDRPLSPGDRD